MSITDELRKWARQFRRVWVDPHSGDLTYITNEHACPPSLDAVRLEDYVIAIADRIDAEHERLMQEQPFTVDMVPMTDERMAEHGWVRLPVDADGEYIHIGERVQLVGNDPSTVSHMSLADDGWRVYVKYDGGVGTGSGEPKRIRHHHAPTVEDLLREFAQEMNENLGMYTGEAIDADEWRAADAKTIAKFTTKLRLKEDA